MTDTGSFFRDTAWLVQVMQRSHKWMEKIFDDVKHLMLLHHALQQQSVIRFDLTLFYIIRFQLSSQREVHSGTEFLTK